MYGEAQQGSRETEDVSQVLESTEASEEAEEFVSTEESEDSGSAEESKNSESTDAVKESETSKNTEQQENAGIDKVPEAFANLVVPIVLPSIWQDNRYAEDGTQTETVAEFNWLKDAYILR